MSPALANSLIPEAEALLEEINQATARTKIRSEHIALTASALRATRLLETLRQHAAAA